MKADFENKTLSYDIPVIYKFKNLIFKLPKDNKELYEYAMYLHCITGGEFNDLIEKHNKEHLIFGVYFEKESYLAKRLKHKNNLGYVLLVSLKDEVIAFDMAIDGERSMKDIEYQCLIEAIFDDEIAKKEKIFKEFSKEFKNLDGVINDAIILMKKRKCKTPVSYLQRKLKIGYNRAEKIKNQVCMFGLLDDEEERMCDCKETLEANKKMFEGFDFGDVVLNYDGYICKEEYENAESKIVFILKESYTDDIERFKNQEEKSSITWLLCNAISNGGKFETNSGMFDKLGMMAYALLKNEFDLNKINKKEVQKFLLKVGYLNVSKEVLIRKQDESKESHSKELNKKFNKYKNLLKKQIDILKPDIIVAFGKIGNEGIFGKIVEEVINKKLKDKNAGEIEVNINNQPVRIFFSYHPAYHSQKDEEFLTQLKEKIKNLDKLQ